MMEGSRCTVITLRCNKDIVGNVLGVFAAAPDITAQRKAKPQVAEQRTKELESLLSWKRFQRLTVGVS